MGPVEEAFGKAAERPTEKVKKEYAKPISVRFTEAERQELERKAGDLTLISYIRSRCIGDTALAHRTRGKRPVKDHEALGRVLGLNEALAALQPDNQFVIWKLDRPFRSLTHALEVLDYIEKRGAEFLDITEGIDTRTSFGRCYRICVRGKSLTVCFISISSKMTRCVLYQNKKPCLGGL